MWGIVIVLVGGIYWGYKYIDEKTNAEIAQKKENDAAEINKKINATLEGELFVKSLLKNEDTRWQTLDSISAELEDVYGVCWRKHFQDDAKFEWEISTIYASWGKAYHLLLSKRGKIPRMFSKTYPLAGGGEKTDQTVRICKHIEKNIQTYYPELRMMFVPGHGISSSYENEYYDDLCRGQLYWEHNIPPRNKKWNPNIRQLW